MSAFSKSIVTLVSSLTIACLVDHSLSHSQLIFGLTTIFGFIPRPCLASFQYHVQVHGIEHM